MAGTPSVQYRVVVGKGDERVAGSDDADIVVTVPLAEVADPEFDPIVAFMRGKLKTTGSTGRFFELMRSGAVGEALRSLASPT